MNKERTTAFEDAILAIIMTILVLELRKPGDLSAQGIWDLRVNFFAYALSFFGIGLMWVSHNEGWHHVQRINMQTVMLTIVLLFFASLFPYTTSLVADHFTNVAAQVLYGIISIIISILNILISLNLRKLNPDAHFSLLYNTPNYLVLSELGIKVAGLIIATLVYPPAMLISIFLAGALLMIAYNQQ